MCARRATAADRGHRRSGSRSAAPSGRCPRTLSQYRRPERPTRRCRLGGWRKPLHRFRYRIEGGLPIVGPVGTTSYQDGTIVAPLAQFTSLGRPAKTWRGTPARHQSGAPPPIPEEGLGVGPPILATQTDESTLGPSTARCGASSARRRSLRSPSRTSSARHRR